MTDPTDARLGYDRIRAAFDSLDPPASGSRLAYAAEPLGSGTVLLGKSQDGAPCLLLPALASLQQQDRHFANLRLRHGLRLRIRRNDTLDTYSVLECVAEDDAIRDWFLRLVPTLHERLESAASFETVEDFVERVSELFRLIDRDAHKSLFGLWGELALIAASDHPAGAVASWHVRGMATHDFTSDGSHVEVKTSDSSRRHHFAPSQLQPGRRVLVASLLLEAADDGASVMDLYAEVLELLPEEPELQQKVHELVIACVGRRLSESEDARFDVPSAVSGIRYFLAEAVPQLIEPFPLGVSDVRFVSDLASVERASISTLEGTPLWANLAGAYLRRHSGQ